MAREPKQSLKLAGARALFGREAELSALDEAWARADVRVLSIVAWGGVGKTALVSCWRTRLLAQGDVEAVFEWSFFSQGSEDRHAVSAEGFVREALLFFGEEELADSAEPQRVKARRLAEVIGERKVLLILDGLEPLQSPPSGAGAGELREDGVVVLLRGLARRNPGLCVITTRQRVRELEEFEGGAAPRLELSRLGVDAGAELLRELLEGVSGVAVVRSSVGERREISEAMGGHALSLQLLGSYIRRALGDVRRWREIDLKKADASVQRGHVWGVMDAYLRWFSGPEDPRERDRVRASYGEAAEIASEGQMQLSVLRMLGLFDRPADPGCIAALRGRPAIAGLTEGVVELDREGWSMLLASLEDARLLVRGAHAPVQVYGYDEEAARGQLEGDPKPWPLVDYGHGAVVIEAHPLVREYFGDELRRRNEAGWREGHRRLYEHLHRSVPYWPDGVEGLQPLYQAVVHGCAAGRVQEVCEAVVRGRIARGQRLYSVKRLGAFGAELAALASLFERAWDRPRRELSSAHRAWLLSLAAFCLRGVGRLGEALEPARACLDMRVEFEDWNNAASAAGNLSELELTLGRIEAAVAAATAAVAHADRSGDEFQRLSKRTTLADARLAAGDLDGARALFEQAEAMEAERWPLAPELVSLGGHRYCELLLCEAERAAWRAGSEPDSPAELLVTCAEVFDRATRAHAEAERGRFLLDVALGHLTVGRAALYAARLHGQAPASELIREQLDAAVEGLREAGSQEFLPKGLLMRAWLHHVEGRPDLAEADLDEAWAIAVRGRMPLVQADIQLHRARLFCDRDALREAARLIHAHAYNRRLPELEDAQAAAARWPLAEAPAPLPAPTMPATTLRILHLSDIHFRSPNGLDTRADAIRRETPRRARVLAGAAWQQNLADLLVDGPIDLVCLTGDIADWGKREEFEQGTKFVESLLDALQLPKSRLLLVPGNHDVDRTIHPEAWQGIRAQPWTTRTAVSDWMANGRPPVGASKVWREQVLDRQRAYRVWVADELGRPELLPANSPHRRLGYRVDVGEALGLSTPVWILGLDTAWLAGDDHDAGKLLVSKDQLLLLGTGDDGLPLPGLRVALGHHPLAELADGGEMRELLAKYADVYLHGHQHQPITTLAINPDGRLLELAAGCLFEGDRKDEHPNGFQVVSLALDERGRPLRAELRFRSWSPRGGYWHDDSAIYRNAPGGRLTLDWPASAEAPAPK